MNFNDYKYERIDIDAVKKQFEELIGSFSKADSAEKQCKIMDEVINLRNHIDTMITLVSDTALILPMTSTIRKTTIAMKSALCFTDLQLISTKLWLLQNSEKNWKINMENSFSTRQNAP